MHVLPLLSCVLKSIFNANGYFPTSQFSYKTPTLSLTTPPQNKSFNSPSPENLNVSRLRRRKSNPTDNGGGVSRIIHVERPPLQIPRQLRFRFRLHPELHLVPSASSAGFRRPADWNIQKDLVRWSRWSGLAGKYQENGGKDEEEVHPCCAW